MLLQPSNFHLKIFLLYLCSSIAGFTAPVQEKVQIAVLITGARFDSVELAESKSRLYARLDSAAALKKVLRLEAGQKEILKKKIDVASLTDSAGYVDAGVKLGMDYVIVVNMVKMGPFAQANFRRFYTCPQKPVVKYFCGAIYPAFVQTEIAAAMDTLLKNIEPQKCRNDGSLYALLVYGAGVAIYFIAEKLWGPDSPDESDALAGIPVEPIARQIAMPRVSRFNRNHFFSQPKK